MTYAAPTAYAAPAMTYAAPTTYAAPQATYATYGAPMQVGAPVGFAPPMGYAVAPGFAQAPGFARPQPKQKKHKCKKHKGSKFEATNQLVPDCANGGCDNSKDVHALVVFCDYGFQPAKSQGWCPAGFGDKLDTYENAMMFKQLLVDSGVRDIVEINNTQATKEAVLQKISEVGARCDGDDTFIFFYSGHGNGMKDQDGDEDDGQDEAMCLPNARGECNESTWLRDDDFADAVCRIRSGHKLVVLDCCHSGTMLDFDKEMWQGQKAIAVVGCKDAQESAGMGGGVRGGAFSQALNAAVRSIGNQTVTVGAVHNELLKQSTKFIPRGHKQDITINCAPGYAGPGKMKWPLKVGGGAPAQQFAPVAQPMGFQVAQPMGYPVAQAAFAQPVFAQQAFAQPGFAQPAFAQQAFAQPGFAQPAFAQQSFAQPGFAQPAFAQQAFVQPGFGRQSYAGRPW